MIKKTNYNTNYCIHPNQHDTFLNQLPKITQQAEHFKTIYSPKEFYQTLLNTIYHACHHIYLTTLYLENDIGGKNIINAILYIKKNRPYIKTKIIVDWYRSQRGRFGESTNYTNFNWYYDIIQQYPEIEIYGVPIHINELLGVFHLKGFIIDDKILYSGANINNEYLHIHDKYRYDRYHIIQNRQLSNIMLEYIETKLLSSQVVNKLGNKDFSKKNRNNNKNNIRLFRKKLRKVCYTFQSNTTSNNIHSCAIIPLVGIGKNSILNKTIYHLISSTKNKIILCTPYFNIPNILIRNLIHLLRNGKKIEIIVGDKIANDFYNSNQTSRSFKLINIIPYLYEINLRIFLKKLHKYIHNNQLIVRLWKKDINGYHVKGIWIDDEWQLITGSNLNPRSLRFDLENALLIHDPCRELIEQKNKELNTIRIYTNDIIHYKSIETISDYPVKVKKIVRRIQNIKLDYLIKYLL